MDIRTMNYKGTAELKRIAAVDDVEGLSQLAKYILKCRETSMYVVDENGKKLHDWSDDDAC